MGARLVVHDGHVGTWCFEARGVRLGFSSTRSRDFALRDFRSLARLGRAGSSRFTIRDWSRSRDVCSVVRSRHATFLQALQVPRWPGARSSTRPSPGRRWSARAAGCVCVAQGSNQAVTPLAHVITRWVENRRTYAGHAWVLADSYKACATAEGPACRRRRCRSSPSRSGWTRRRPSW